LWSCLTTDKKTLFVPFFEVILTVVFSAGFYLKKARKGKTKLTLKIRNPFFDEIEKRIPLEIRNFPQGQGKAKINSGTYMM
jgi:hypothetical protein